VLGANPPNSSKSGDRIIRRSERDRREGDIGKGVTETEGLREGVFEREREGERRRAVVRGERKAWEKERSTGWVDKNNKKILTGG
jgi:hypothetical protein